MPSPDRRRKPIARRVKGAGILPATVLVLIALFVVAGLIWVLFTRLLRDAWPWQVGGLETTTPTPGFQTTQLVLTLVGGVGAAILVVVAYRRQRDLELARFDERFAAAAAQLGAPTAAERLAGVYAMAALADTWEIHRQQCIDVLCGYLRLPYDPTNTLLKTVANERTWYVNDRAERKETRTYEQLPNDREVRLTIISTITRHLRDPADGGAPTSWQGHDLDFTGATFDGGDFSRANFSDGKMTFSGARFTGGRVNFDRARFTGGRVVFDSAGFMGGLVTFDGAEFVDGRVSFEQATRFEGSVVTFFAARFIGGQVNFNQAQFTAGEVSFNAAHVADGRVVFDLAEFAGGKVTFDYAEFIGGLVGFGGTRFAGGDVTFNHADFAGSEVAFGSAHFADGRVSFELAEFTGNPVTFDYAEFTGGMVNFDDAQFTSGRVTFGSAEFAGGVVTRDGADFRGWPPPAPDPEQVGPGAG